MSRRKKFTWQAAMDLFETHLRAKRASTRTRHCYLIELEHLGAHVGHARPADVTLQDLREFQCGLLVGSTSRTRKALSAATVARIATTISVFFAFLAAEGRIPENPAARLERPRVPRYPPGEVLTVAEVQRLLAPEGNPTPRGVRDRTLIELLFATGLRRSEIIALDLGDLNRAEREVLVRRGKGEKSRIVPVTRSAFVRITDYISLARPHLQSDHADSATALFLSQRGRRLSKRALANALKKLGEEARLKKIVKPHVMRRTFATTLLKAGVSVRHIQILLGHSDLNTTALYLRLDTRELRRELLLKHPRETFKA